MHFEFSKSVKELNPSAISKSTEIWEFLAPIPQTVTFFFCLLVISNPWMHHQVLLSDVSVQTCLFTLYVNLRTDRGGGGYPPPPLRFFPDSVKTAARSAAKFGMTIPTFIAHITLKF